jgi:hypothetical protein
MQRALPPDEPPLCQILDKTVHKLLDKRIVKHSSLAASVQDSTERSGLLINSLASRDRDRLQVSYQVLGGFLDAEA